MKPCINFLHRSLSFWKPETCRYHLYGTTYNVVPFQDTHLTVNVKNLYIYQQRTYIWIKIKMNSFTELGNA